jgi:hypothetical protein
MSKDFPNGLQSASDYLDARHHISGTTASGTDAARVAFSAEYSFTLRELLCGMLSGNGVKLPNIQLCLHANIQELLKIPNIQGEIADALNQLLDSVESFMDHTKIDNVLGRLNSVLAEAQNVANLINFCAQPVDPIAIPNMLERAMGSFLGAGKQLANDIGSIDPSNVCACISTSGGFNASVFNGGVLGRIANNIDDITNGSLIQSELDAIKNDISGISDRMSNLINFENNINGGYTKGGSQFATPDSGCNNEIGVLHNPLNSNVGASARVTSQMKSLYDRLGAYPVQYSLGSEYDSNGDRVLRGDVVEYPNIFHLLFDDEILAILQRDDDYTGNLNNQTPVYDYCGNIIGYTKEHVERQELQSEGSIPTVPNSPGFNAGGVITSNGGTGSSGTTGGTTIINNFNNTGNNLYLVNSEAGQLALQANTDDIVVRTDILTIFTRRDTTTNNTGTLSDYQQATSTLFEFLNNLNVEADDGLIVKDSGVSRARAVEGKSGETKVINGDGKAGNIRVELEENTRIPGTAAVKIPVGNTSQRPNTEVGEIRYNTDNDRLEGYFGNTASWQSIALMPDILTTSSSLTSIGTGADVFKQTVSNTSEIRSLTAGSGITITENADDIQIGDQITSSNIGSGSQLFKQRTANNFEFRTLVSTDNSITFSQTADTVDISGDPNVKKTTTSTSGSGATAIQVNGVYPEPATGKTWFFTGIAIGRASTGQVQAFKIEGLADNQTGTPTIVGNTIMKTDYQRNTADAVQTLWDPLSSYATNDLVEYDGNIYEASTNISGGAASPDTNSDWTLYYSGWNFTAEIDAGGLRFKVKGDGTAPSVSWDVRITFLEV